MAASACLRLAALLVVVVVVVGDGAACPSLLLQNRSCIMTPIRCTLFHSGMRSLCSRALTQTHKLRDGAVGEKSGCAAARYGFVCVWAGIGKSSELGGDVQRFPLM